MKNRIVNADPNAEIIPRKIPKVSLFDKLKFERLQKWCIDVNNRQTKVEYKSLYIKQEEWEKNKAKNFDEVIKLYKED